MTMAVEAKQRPREDLTLVLSSKKFPQERPSLDSLQILRRKRNSLNYFELQYIAQTDIRQRKFNNILRRLSSWPFHSKKETEMKRYRASLAVPAPYFFSTKISCSMMTITIGLLFIHPFIRYIFLQRIRCTKDTYYLSSFMEYFMQDFVWDFMEEDASKTVTHYFNWRKIYRFRFNYIQLNMKDHLFSHTRLLFVTWHFEAVFRVKWLSFLEKHYQCNLITCFMSWHKIHVQSHHVWP